MGHFLATHQLPPHGRGSIQNGSIVDQTLFRGKGVFFRFVLLGIKNCFLCLSKTAQGWPRGNAL